MPGRAQTAQALAMTSTSRIYRSTMAPLTRRRQRCRARRRRRCSERSRMLVPPPQGPALVGIIPAAGLVVPFVAGERRPETRW
jgi:hypothetical protein